MFDYSEFLSRLTSRPGVYRMLGENHDVLYVGKAKNLKKRVGSYFRSSGLSPKTTALVSLIRQIEVTVTNTETEALLLENNLIKQCKPPFNILLRDDKTYPYIQISEHDDYPALYMKRFRHQKPPGLVFGPYPSSHSVRESLVLLQKLFKVRQCEESFYRNRSRPCLQHQIGRCSAPCVGLISVADYQQAVRNTLLFLQGKSPELIQSLIAEMDSAASELRFEKAAELRDQISLLRQLQDHQVIEGRRGDVDVIAIARSAGTVSVSVLFVRGGKIIGHKNLYPRVVLDESDADVLSDFIAQFYLGGLGAADLPKEIVVSELPRDRDLLQEVLAGSSANKIKIISNVIADRAAWMRLCKTNAENAVSSRDASQDAIRQRLVALSLALNLDDTLSRIECFDISHSSGEKTVASCVAFGKDGAIKADYRCYNVEGVTNGDDFAAMRFALHKRYKKLAENMERCPDIVLIDGGLGQLKIAEQVFSELQIQGVELLGIAKGETRKAGFEYLIRMGSHQEVRLPPDSSALHLLQQIRDEAHRFAVTGHRQRRDKARRQSVLEDIEGVGAKRRKELVKYFGGLQGLQNASPEEIAKVSGISARLAKIIYSHFHHD
ncbi:MAG: excinuclease ABC subunit UvrC [Hahellaceae bacterium]|nr:excinuclease ABC subunit UvrC [Hahellaceae bacterium]